MNLLNNIFFKLYKFAIKRVEKGKLKKVYSGHNIHNTVQFFNPLKTNITGNIKIGKGTYINSGRLLAGKGSSISIGEYCAIGHNVTMSSITHDLKRPTGENILHLENDIIIGNHVWIGSNVFIKDGVSIGDYAIIGANSFVNKDVESYNVVGGVPARIIGVNKRD
jgi:maltose O-acetyltransferase